MTLNSTWSPEYAADYSGQSLLNVCISFAVLETVFIIAFILSWYLNSGTNNNSLNPVIYLILIGYIFCFAGVLIGIFEVVNGAGYHATTLHPRQLTIFLQLMKSHEFVYVTSIVFPKFATLYLYFRIFPSKKMRFIIYGTTLLVAATFLFGILSASLNCRPFSSFWNTSIQKDCTMDSMAAFRFYSIPNISSDAFIVFIPLPALRKLRVKLPTKIGIYLAFLAMTFGLLTAIFRFTYVLNSSVFGDITYLGTTITSWTIIEPGVCLVAATIPTLGPLVRCLSKQANDFRSHTPSKFTFTERRSPNPLDSYNPSHLSNTNNLNHITRPARVLQKKSSKGLQHEFFGTTCTVGHRPSRLLRLDDYHYLQNEAVMGLRSEDEESLVCESVRIEEQFAREGRNRDGTLRIWSLQRPMQISPLRTSFLFVNTEKSEVCHRYD